MKPEFSPIIDESVSIVIYHIESAKVAIARHILVDSCHGGIGPFHSCLVLERVAHLKFKTLCRRFREGKGIALPVVPTARNEFKAEHFDGGWGETCHFGLNQRLVVA